MNMFLHDDDSARIEWEDTIRYTLQTEDRALRQLAEVNVDPPWQEISSKDPAGCFFLGTSPSSTGYWDRIATLLATDTEEKVRVAVMVPQRVLFQDGQEGKIRETVIRDNLLDAVIGLPENLFFGTGIPAALMIFNKTRNNRETVLVIDASRDFEQGQIHRNTLRGENIEKIIDTYRARKAIERFSTLASFELIAENAFNLNILRYFEPIDPKADIATVQRKIAQLEANLAETRQKIDHFLRKLRL